jgi:hypothetical protein
LAPEPLRQLHEWTGSFRTIWDIPGAVHERHGTVPPGTDAPFTAQRFVAATTGGFTPDGRFAGGWRPNAGADESVNVAYDISGSLVA